MEFEEIFDKIQIFEEENGNLYWGNYLAEEVGKICRLFRDQHNNEINIKKDLKYELADLLNYIVLIAKYNDIDLEKAILEKIENVKENRNEEVKNHGNETFLEMCKRLKIVPTRMDLEDIRKFTNREE